MSKVICTKHSHAINLVYALTDFFALSKPTQSAYYGEINTNNYEKDLLFRHIILLTNSTYIDPYLPRKISLKKV